MCPGHSNKKWDAEPLWDASVPVADIAHPQLAGEWPNPLQMKAGVLLSFFLLSSLCYYVCLFPSSRKTYACPLVTTYCAFSLITTLFPSLFPWHREKENSLVFCLVISGICLGGCGARLCCRQTELIRSVSLSATSGKLFMPLRLVWVT